MNVNLKQKELLKMRARLLGCNIGKNTSKNKAGKKVDFRHPER